MSKPKRPRTESPSILSGEQRINKLLAAAGLGSRRQVDELITDGRVEIDGKTITQVGVKVDADTAKISVDGEPLKRHRPLYFAVHKPAGVLCTNSDPEGRPRVIDLVPGHSRLFPVGRLDSSSTGLILLTNDGELAQRLAHPRNSVPKSYYVVVAGQVEMDSMRRLQRGIYLAEGFARVDGAKIRRVRKGCTEIEITLSEGKNREIRRVLARLGHKVITLRRLAIGPLRLATMPEGSYRPLSQDEVAQLYNAVEEIKKEKKIQRKEKDRHRSAEMNGVGANIEVDRLEVPAAGASVKHSPAKGAGGKAVLDPAKSKSQKVKKKSKREESLDTLPPLSENPYSEAEDQDPEESRFQDSVLVKETGPMFDEDFEAPVRKGKVLSYEDADDAGFEDDDDDFGSDGMGFESFDDDEDDDAEEIDEEDLVDIDSEEVEVRKSTRKPQQARDADRASKPSRSGSRNSTSKSASPRSASPRSASPRSASPRARSSEEGASSGFARKKGVGRPSGPNSGQRGRPTGAAGRKASSAARKGASSSRFGESSGRPSSSRPSKGAARSGSGFSNSKTASGKSSGSGRPSGTRTGFSATKKKSAGGRSFGAPKGKRGGGKGRSSGNR